MQLTQLKTKEIVQKTFDAIVEALVTERRIELRNFGVFEVKKRAARKARNPRTGERVDVSEKYVVTFKPGKEMEERVRQLEEAEAEGRPLPPRSVSSPAVRATEAAGEPRRDLAPRSTASLGVETGSASEVESRQQVSGVSTHEQRGLPSSEPKPAAESWRSHSYAPGGAE